MISFFEQISEIVLSNRIHLQVCFSSRHYPNITMRRSVDLIVEKHKGHDHDIMRYIRGALNIGQGATVKTIRSELRRKANGIFMWVVLVIKMLNKEYDRGRTHSLLRRLHDTPGDLHEFFRDMLTRDKHDKKELLLVLQLLLFARTPLDAADIYRAILVSTDSIFDFEEIVNHSTMSMFIIDSSKGLVEMDSLGKPQFTDFLLKDHFMKQVLQSPGVSARAQREEAIKSCCSKFLNLLPLEYVGQPKSGNASHSNSAVARKYVPTCETIESTNPRLFLRYATENVFDHAEVAAGGGICQNKFLLDFPMTTWILARNKFLQRRGKVPKYTLESELLYVFATEGRFPKLISAHPSSVFCTDIDSAAGESPFLGSVHYGLKENMKVFLGVLATMSSCQSQLADLYRGVDSLDLTSLSSSPDGWCRWKTLCALANLGNAELFKFFLDTGRYDVNARVDADKRTPLIIAAAHNHPSIVQHLLENPNIDINAKDTWGGNALFWGVYSRNDHSVRFLLAKKKVDVNVRVEKSGPPTPLMLEAKNGDCAIIQQLVKVPDIDVGAKDTCGWNALHQAVYHQNELAVRLLLATKKVDVNARTNNLRTPLMMAVNKGDHTIVQQLMLVPEVEVDSRKCKQMFFPAVVGGYRNKVKALLLTNEIEVNSRHADGETPLTLAVRHGYEEMVAVLLGVKEIDANIENADGETPVSIERKRKNHPWRIVDLLLQRQVGG
jgi:ankyrin repeat protein